MVINPLDHTQHFLVVYHFFDHILTTKHIERYIISFHFILFLVNKKRINLEITMIVLFRVSSYVYGEMKERKK